MTHPNAKFHLLSSHDLRAIDRLSHRLADAPDLTTLGRELVGEMAHVLPADCMLWNLWTPTMDAILAFESNDPGIELELERHADALNATIHHHPVIAAGHLESSWIQPQRMTDYESYRSFRTNPLFQEAYRHLESHYQIAYSAAKLECGHIVLSWNLKDRDFTDQDVQRLHLVGLRVGVISRHLDEARRLAASWQILGSRLSEVSGLSMEGQQVAPPLAAVDGKILAGLVRGETRVQIAARLGWRRDTLDKHLGMLREHMGLTNTTQLMSSLAEMRYYSSGHRLMDHGTPSLK